MRNTILILLGLTGCVPLTEYRKLEMKLSAQMSERNNQTRITICDDQIAKLEAQLKEARREAAKSKPVATSAPVETIKPADLEEIKKKALAVTEERFELRKRLRQGK